LVAETTHVTALSPTDLELQLLERVRANRIQIPSYPAIATKLQAMVAAGRSTEQVAAVAANDPPLVAALLARATSAQHASAGQLGIAAAIQRVGMDELVQIAVAQSVGAIALAPGPLAAIRRDTWRRSLVAGRVAQVLCSRCGMAPSEAYLAGLLQDFGSTAALSAIEQLSKEHELPTQSELDWRAVVSRVRGEFGGAIAKRWSLPASIAGVIAEDTDSPLARLLDHVRRVVALLDDDRLDEAVDVTTDEREAILAALPEIIAQMALYTHTLVSRHALPIEPPPRMAESWPVQFDVRHRGTSYAACSVSVEGIDMVGKMSLATNWLVCVTLECKPEPIELLLNVRQCEPRDDGTCAIWAKPFGLGAVAKQRWLSLLDAARPA
jgi:HD-like signal output (HDOD) protein